MRSDSGRMWLGSALAAWAWVAGAIADAGPIDWVSVGDAGNAADTIAAGPYGAVAYDYRIMRYEWTNAQYVSYLNAVDPQGTNPSGIYDGRMGADARGGISFASGNPDGSKYTVRSNMADKPVNFVTWFQAARVANWLQAGSQNYATSAAGDVAINDGAYTLIGIGPGTVSKNSGANYWIPLENEWYKAAYYKGGGTNAGYWEYATGATGTAPTLAGATELGVGSFSGVSPLVAGHFANANRSADWNGLDGNVTSVGTNGGPSAYGAYDFGGNVWEWADKGPDITQVIRGGSWEDGSLSGFAGESQLTSSARIGNYPLGAFEAGNFMGFRLSSSASLAVPEIDPAGMGSVLALLAGAIGLLERRRLSFGTVRSAVPLCDRGFPAENRSS